ncbi:adenylyl-sulfate kinase [Arthrobacter pigmenti]
MTAWQDALHEPGHSFDYEVLDTLELLLGGLLDDSTSYALPRPAAGQGPAAPALTVPASAAEDAIAQGVLQLKDPDGTPLARLRVEGSESGPDNTCLAGPVSPMQPAEHGIGRDVRLVSPLAHSAGHPQQVAAVFNRVPAAEEIARAVVTASRLDAQLHLVAIAHSAEPGNRMVSGLLETLRACAGELEDAAAHLLVVPGYDAQLPGSSHTLGSHVLERLGASQLLDFSATDEEPAHQRAADGRSGLVVLFTGLSGSGKSTLARELVQQSHRVDSRQALLLDGDDIRRFLTAGLGFSREDRNTNVERIGWVAAQISSVGGIAVCAPIAPFEESRQRVRELAEHAGDFILVHVSTPLEVCEERDRKGLYAKARAGSIPDFTGISSPYDVPAAPDYAVNTAVTSVEDATAHILDLIRDRKAAASG